MPSATVPMPSARASATIASTIACLLAGFLNGEPLHERLVDLDAIDRQPYEVRKARVAGAEIVERDGHANPSYGRKRARRGGEVAHDGSLRHFDVEYGDAYAGRLGRLRNQCGEVAFLNRRGRQIDGDLEWRAACRLPPISRLTNQK